MTDPMELVERLEEDAAGAMACGETCITSTALLTEAAACIREMVEWRPIADHDNSATEVLVMEEGWSKPIVAWRHHPSSRTDEWLSVPGAYRVYPSRFCPLPPAPGAEA